MRKTLTTIAVALTFALPLAGQSRGGDAPLSQPSALESFSVQVLSADPKEGILTFFNGRSVEELRASEEILTFVEQARSAGARFRLSLKAGQVLAACQITTTGPCGAGGCAAGFRPVRIVCDDGTYYDGCDYDPHCPSAEVRSEIVVDLSGAQDPSPLARLKCLRFLPEYGFVWIRNSCDECQIATIMEVYGNGSPTRFFDIKVPARSQVKHKLRAQRTKLVDERPCD